MGMSSTPHERKMPSALARAEAAAWIARLHGPNRTPEVEAGLRRWLAENPERAVALELLNDTWEKSALLRRRPSERLASGQSRGFRLAASLAALATVAIAAIAAGTLYYLTSRGVSTAVGEQRTVSLADGTRVYLNTDTQMVERYDRDARRVELRRGEALFEVTKKPDWPFIVSAGNHEVRALGTAFLVRREPGQLTVTLVEGKITVSPMSEEPRSGAAEGIEREALEALPSSAAGTFTLGAGERLRYRAAESPKLDRPPIDQVTAWQRGQVALDDMSLADAAAEMNRYSTRRLVIADAATAAIRISGIFRAGDQESFARAVARTYGLSLSEGPRSLVLTGPRSLSAERTAESREH
jgi:transmembrane sensor